MLSICCLCSIIFDLHLTCELDSILWIISTILQNGGGGISLEGWMNYLRLCCGVRSLYFFHAEPQDFDQGFHCHQDKGRVGPVRLGCLSWAMVLLLLRDFKDLKLFKGSSLFSFGLELSSDSISIFLFVNFLLKRGMLTLLERSRLLDQTHFFTVFAKVASLPSLLNILPSFLVYL